MMDGRMQAGGRESREDALQWASSPIEMPAKLLQGQS